MAVFGAGAVGSFLGGLLDLGGQRTSLIGRARALSPVADQGLVLQRADGTRQIAHPQVFVPPEAIEGSFDLILLTVKAYSVASALDSVSALLAPSGRIVGFQNGVGTDRLLIERFGAQRVVAATCTVSVGMNRPGCVDRYTRGGGIAWSDYGDPEEEYPVQGLLERTGLPVSCVGSPDSLRWAKLLLNAIGSAQTAILETDLSTLVSNRSLFRIEQVAFRETLDVLSAATIPVIDLPGYPVRLVAAIMRLPLDVARAALGRGIARGRGGKAPTLRSDVSRGGPTENAYLNGATVILGRKVGVKTPVNAALARLVDEVTESSSAKRRYRHNPAALVAQVTRAPTTA